MKQFFLLLVFLGFVAMANVNAQCTKSAAARTAALSSNIIEKKDAKTGEIVFLKKNVCPSTGQVSYAQVEYCSKSGQFVNATPTYYKSSCVKSVVGCTKTYNKNASMVSNEMPYLYLVAKKAACLTANQKTQAARAAYASLERKEIKP